MQMFPLNISENGDMTLKSLNVGGGAVKVNRSGRVTFGDETGEEDEITFRNVGYSRTSNEVRFTTFSAHGLSIGETIVVADADGGLKNGLYRVSGILSSIMFAVTDTESGQISGKANLYIGNIKLQIGSGGSDVIKRDASLLGYADNSYQTSIRSNESTLFITNNRKNTHLSYSISDGDLTVTFPGHDFVTGDSVKISNPVNVTSTLTKINDDTFTVPVGQNTPNSSGTDLAVDEDVSSVCFSHNNSNGIALPMTRLKTSRDRFEVDSYRPSNRDIICLYQENIFETDVNVTNGTSPVSRNTGFGDGIEVLCFSRDTFVGLSGDSVLLTSAGETWIRKTLGVSQSWRSVIFANRIFVAVGGIIITSLDGSVWSVSQAPSLVYTGVAFGIGLYVAVGTGGISVSSDTIVWTEKPQSFTREYTDIVFGENRFVSSSTSGIAYSDDGETWSLSSLTTGDYVAVSYGNGLFVAFGRNGRVATSLDGIDWNVVIQSSSVVYTDVSHGNGLFVATTTTDIRVSTDGISWSIKYSTPGGFLALAFGDNRFVVTGGGGSVVTFDMTITNSMIITIDDSIVTGDRIYVDVLTGGGKSGLYDVVQASSSGGKTEIILMDPLRTITGRETGSASISLVQKYSRTPDHKKVTITLNKMIQSEYTNILEGDLIYVSFLGSLSKSASYTVTSKTETTIEAGVSDETAAIEGECIILRGGFQSRFNLLSDGRVGFNVLPRPGIGLDTMSDVKVGGGLYVRGNIQRIPKFHNNSGDYVIGEEGTSIDIFDPSFNQSEAWLYTLENSSNLLGRTRISTGTPFSIVIIGDGDNLILNTTRSTPKEFSEYIIEYSVESDPFLPTPTVPGIGIVSGLYIFEFTVSNPSQNSTDLYLVDEEGDGFEVWKNIEVSSVPSIDTIESDSTGNIGVLPPLVTTKFRGILRINRNSTVRFSFGNSVYSVGQNEALLDLLFSPIETGFNRGVFTSVSYDNNNLVCVSGSAETSSPGELVGLFSDGNSQDPSSFRGIDVSGPPTGVKRERGVVYKITESGTLIWSVLIYSGSGNVIVTSSMDPGTGDVYVISRSNTNTLVVVDNSPVLLGGENIRTFTEISNTLLLKFDVDGILVGYLEFLSSRFMFPMGLDVSSGGDISVAFACQNRIFIRDNLQNIISKYSPQIDPDDKYNTSSTTTINIDAQVVGSLLQPNIVIGTGLSYLENDIILISLNPSVKPDGDDDVFIRLRVTGYDPFNGFIGGTVLGISGIGTYNNWVVTISIYALEDGRTNIITDFSQLTSDFKVSLFKINKQLTSVLGEASISTGITQIQQMGFTDQGLSAFRIKEGVIRYSNSTLYLTVPINQDVSRIFFFSGSVFTNAILGSFKGSICMGISGSYTFSNISTLCSIRQASSESGNVTTVSIDLDNGPTGNSQNPGIYIGGTCSGAINFTPFFKFGNKFSPGRTTGSRISERKGAFLCKLFVSGELDWFSMIDGSDDEQAFSIAVNNDIQDSFKGAYSVYILGSFTSSAMNVFDSRKGTLNRADTSVKPVTTLFKMLENGSAVQREAFIMKFDQDGKYLLTFKTSTSELVTPIYLDVSAGDNVIACYKTSSTNVLFKEPDGRVCKTLTRGSIYDIGAVIKYRPTNALVVTPPNQLDFNLRKNIVNKSDFSLYLEAYRRYNGSRETFSDVFVVPSGKGLTIHYTNGDWIAGASDTLSSDLLFLDVGNGKFGLGVSNPRTTLDIAGDINIAGLASFSTLDVNGGLKTVGDIVVNGLDSVVNTTPYVNRLYQITWFPNIFATTGQLTTSNTEFIILDGILTQPTSELSSLFEQQSGLIRFPPVSYDINPVTVQEIFVREGLYNYNLFVSNSSGSTVTLYVNVYDLFGPLQIKRVENLITIPGILPGSSLIQFSGSADIPFDGHLEIYFDSIFYQSALYQGSTRVALSLETLPPPSQYPYTINGSPLIPIGAIIIWNDPNNIPDGWAICDGKVRGGIRVPDLRGRFVLGYSQISESVANQGDFNPSGGVYDIRANTIGEISGEDLSIMGERMIPRHSHAVPYRGDGIFLRAANNNRGGSGPVVFYSESVSSNGGNQRHNNMPPYYSLIYICKI